MSGQQTRARQERADALAEIVARCQETSTMKSWTEFVQELRIPHEMLPAFLTLRPELMKLVPPRALTEAQCKIMFDLIAGLVATNFALRKHAEQVAQMVETWTQAFRQLESVGFRIEDFANFRTATGEEP